MEEKLNINILKNNEFENQLLQKENCINRREKQLKKEQMEFKQ